MTRQKILSVLPFLKRIARDNKGGLLVMTAILMPVLGGFAGLGIDATMWITHKRYIQSMADAGALAGGFLAATNSSTSMIQSGAQSEAARNGLNLGSGPGQDAITINSPPAAGAYAGKNGYVELVITRNAPLYFSSLLNINSVKVKSRAVAGSVGVGKSCILALNKSADKAVAFTGSTGVVINCGVTSNSSSSQAIYIYGNANLTADPAQAYGDIYIGGSSTLITNSPVEPYAQRLPDPYANLTVPSSPAGCTFQGSSVGNNAALTPGRYCGNVVLKGNVTLAPGTYIIDGGSLSSSGNTNITGTGVTIIMTASTPANIGTVKFTGNVSSTLSAPTSNSPYDGVLFYQDPRAPAGGLNSFLGNNTMNYVGGIYFPSQEIDFSGNGTVTSSCLQVVADKVTFSGSSNISNTESSCAAADVDPISRTQVQLVE